MIATHGGGKRRWERLHTWEETKGRQYETTQQWIIHNLCGSASGGKQLTNLSLWSDRYACPVLWCQNGSPPNALLVVQFGIVEGLSDPLAGRSDVGLNNPFKRQGG